VFDRGLSHPNIRIAKENTVRKAGTIIITALGIAAICFVALYGITYIIITGKWEPMNG